MSFRAHSRPSLTGRLLLVLLSSLTAVALMLGAGGALFSHKLAEQTGDRVLKASARSIAETLVVEEGEITLDLPAAAFGMLESDARTNIYYSIRHEGRLLTGYPDFPRARPQDLQAQDTAFRYETYRGARVRVATEVRQLPRIEGLVVVQVAETLDDRQALLNRMLIGLALLEGALILVAGLLVWPAVRWSLRPLTRLRGELEARSEASADFTPLKLDAVPVELRGLVGGFNALPARLNRAAAGMRRFTADASHQMRTPLAVLRTHVTVLREHGTHSPEGQASLDDIELAIERLGRLLTQLIALARAEETTVATAKTQMFDLAPVVAEVARRLAPSAVEREIKVDFECETQVDVRGDPVLTAEIVSNLLENAIRYNRPGGSVAVRIEADPDGPRVLVEDDGPGIPESDYGRVFERFHRLSRDRDRLGSGLGLPIVQTLSQAMGAQIALAPGVDGRGLRVTLTFPETAN